LINPVHQLLLARLDSTPAPTISLRELTCHAEPLWLPLITAGVLVEDDMPEEIEPSPAHTLTVKKIGDAYFGFDRAEDFPSPRPLAREDVIGFRVVASGLAAHLRTVNSIDGRNPATATSPTGLHLIGRKSTPCGVVSVWLAAALGAPDTATGHLATLAQDEATTLHVVVFPVWPDVPITAVAALSSRGVHLADLDPASLAVRWPTALRRDAAPSDPEYGLIHEGATWRVHFLGETCTIPDKTGSLFLARILSDHRYQWTPTEVYTGNKNAVPKSSNSRTTATGEQEDGTRISQTMSAGAGRASDQEAARIRTDRQELMEALRQAQREEDAAEEARITEELAEFDETYASTLGLGNRSRSDGPEESTRKNVSLQISNILNALAKTQPAVAKHIRDRLSLGSAMTYTPDREEAWTVVFPKK
jgi:hypothetical protein